MLILSLTAIIYIVCSFGVLSKVLFNENVFIIIYENICLTCESWFDSLVSVRNV